MNQIIPREARKLLCSAFEDHDCVVLLGPRQVGKTTLALEFSKEYSADWDLKEDYKDLEQSQDQQVLQDIDAFIAGKSRRIIVLDEAQCMPGIFPKLRSLLDRPQKSDHDKVRWLILGSATNELEALVNQNLSGRHKIILLTPFQLMELHASHSRLTTTSTKVLSDSPEQLVSIPESSVEPYELTKNLWLKGGFPSSNLANIQTSLEWRTDYIKSILGPQSPLRSENLNSELLIRLWERLAIEQGKCNIQTLPGMLGCRKSNLDELLYFFESGNLIRRVRVWHRNPRKRLDKNPLFFIRDSGLLHSQLRIHTIDALQQNSIKGKSWEGFVLESVLALSPPSTQVFYYRADDAYEVDFVLEFDASRLWVIEVKCGNNQSVSRGFYRACEEINPEQRFVIHGGPESFKSGNQKRLDRLCLYDALQAVLEKRPVIR